MTERSNARHDGQDLPLTPEQWALVTAPESQSMAESIVRNMGDLGWRFGARLDDLRAHALDGLIAAARRFDPDRGIPFGGFAWLRVRGHVLRAIRHAGNEMHLVRTLDVVHPDPALSSDPSVVGPAQLAPRMKALAAARERLPVDHARLIEAVYFQGVPLRRVARELGKSESATSRLHRDALARLRHQLAVQGFPPPPVDDD